MSFLAASEDTMVFELWPKAMKNEIRRLQGDNDYASWELFPASLQDMAKWADVYQDHEQRDKSRDRILIYKEVPDAEPGTIYPVAIRLHGILGKFRVERFRNWSGREADVARAVQYRDQPRKSKEPALTATQDPEGRYICVQDRWNVVRPLTVANLTDAGKVVPMDAVLLTEGDFVDVGAELDFVLSRDRQKGTSLKCFLTCTHVVRLIPAHYVSDLMHNEKRADRKHTTTPPPQERAVKKAHTTLYFDDE
ncbi:uncharacterized protein F5891DRAFT_989133 [Suillus fuscotomentosus]|uniref:Uncharacterized protein n=1 Tax=Suillus fuscotomentosus TaxID=1912939 RepID=A0AAD4DNH5_9AGAM|nr:uncharacterized protein F5891DRAFT_989133 [Suillus fuscotomentosus]KAG1886355.1 hypothetical protein F5891DRAFT_989133 [Suillus fuscotomentosus]